VDSNGNPLKYVTEGTRTSKYVRESDGIEVPRIEVCKKINGKVLPRFSPTKSVASKSIKVIEGNDFNEVDMWGLERGWYVAQPDVKARKLLDAGKVITFPFAMAAGHKAWRAVLKKHNLGTAKEPVWAYIVVAVRFDARDIIKQFMTEPIEIELPVNDDDNVSDALDAMGV
jgi:hypothetical protein